MTDTDQDRDPVHSLIGCYLTELERQGRDAPLPLQTLASLPKPAREKATFTLRLLRACWNAGPDQTDRVHNELAGMRRQPHPGRSR